MADQSNPSLNPWYFRVFLWELVKKKKVENSTFLGGVRTRAISTFFQFWRGVVDKKPKKYKLGNMPISGNPEIQSFSGRILFSFFTNLYPKNTWMKNRPYWMIKQAQNIRKTPKYTGFREELDWSAIYI